MDTVTVGGERRRGSSRKVLLVVVALVGLLLLGTAGVALRGWRLPSTAPAATSVCTVSCYAVTYTVINKTDRTLSRSGNRGARLQTVHPGGSFEVRGDLDSLTFKQVVDANNNLYISGTGEGSEGGNWVQFRSGPNLNPATCTVVEKTFAGDQPSRMFYCSPVGHSTSRTWELQQGGFRP